jgi:hypothetical protein
MDKKLPPRVQFDFQEDQGEAEIHEDEKIDVSQSELEEYESYEAEMVANMPEIVEKPKPVEEDIFDLPNLAVKPDYLEINDPPEVPPVESTLTKNPAKPKPVKQKKARKPMSEEHKKKLALAREKAMAVRKAKAEERKQMKEVETKTKQLRQKKKIKEMKELEEEVSDKPKPVKMSTPSYPSINMSTITKKDLEEAQFEAISKYESLRKQRKEEKRKKEAIEKSKQDLVEKLKPTGYRYRDGSNRWDSCY